MASANQWKPTHMQHLESTDKALDGQGFSVFIVVVDDGLTIDQPRMSFTVAGPSSLPTPDELWDEFKSRHIGHITGDDFKKFLEFVKFSGYVQIERTIQMMVQYGR